MYKNDCIKRDVCKYVNDQMCPMECGHYVKEKQKRVYVKKVVDDSWMHTRDMCS